MIKIFEKYSAESVLSIYSVSKEEANSRGIVRVGENVGRGSKRSFHITDIIEKPNKLEVSNPAASACRYIFTDKIFDALGDAEKDKNGELQLTAGIKELLEKDYEVLGDPLPDGISRHDTGNFEGYFNALKQYIAKLGKE